jgi:hypothetical protein
VGMAMSGSARGGTCARHLRIRGCGFGAATHGNGNTTRIAPLCPRRYLPRHICLNRCA